MCDGNESESAAFSFPTPPCVSHCASELTSASYSAHCLKKCGAPPSYDDMMKSALYIYKEVYSQQIAISRRDDVAVQNQSGESRSLWSSVSIYRVEMRSRTNASEDAGVPVSTRVCALSLSLCLGAN